MGECGFCKGCIGLPCKVEDIGGLLMKIPEQINTYNIHSHSLAHLNALFPVFAWDTWEMEFTGTDYKRLPIE